MDISSRASSYKKVDGAITGALFALLETKDFHQISVSDIIKKAGINRSTFYRHYVDKYDILDKIKEIAAPLGEKMLALVDESRTPFDLLFNSDYLKKGVPEHYKKMLFLLLKVRTDSFDMEKVVKDGFASQYKPGDNSNKAKIQRDLYADICYRLLIHSISDGEELSGVNIYDTVEELLKSLVPG